jgi:L-fuconolactonase
MYGGDWPVCQLAGGYTRTFEGLHAALDVSPSELDDIHVGTATTWYRLDGRP